MIVIYNFTRPLFVNCKILHATATACFTAVAADRLAVAARSMPLQAGPYFVWWSLQIVVAASIAAQTCTIVPLLMLPAAVLGRLTLLLFHCHPIEARRVCSPLPSKIRRPSGLASKIVWWLSQCYYLTTKKRKCVLGPHQTMIPKTCREYRHTS